MFPWGVSEQQGPVQGAWDYVLLRVWFNCHSHMVSSQGQLTASHHLGTLVMVSTAKASLTAMLMFL